MDGPTANAMDGTFLFWSESRATHPPPTSRRPCVEYLPARPLTQVRQVDSLEDGLKRGKLRNPQGVKSEGEFSGLRGLQEGVYFVSADVRPSPGIATWAVSAEQWRTGGGLILAIDPAARAVTDFGADLDPSGFGLDGSAEGYEESRDCVGR